MIGTVKGLGEVYYNPVSLANILSLAHVDRKGFRVTLDTKIEAAFIVHDISTGIKKIIGSNNGLHYYDASGKNKNRIYNDSNGQ